MILRLIIMTGLVLSLVLEAESQAPSTNRAVAAPVAAIEPDTEAAGDNSEVSKKIETANTLMARDQWEEALNLFKQAVKLDPQNKRALFGLGTTYIHLERYKEALDIMIPLVKAYPSDYYLKNNLAWLYATAKDISIRDGTKAVKMAQEAMLMSPNDYHVWSTLSEGYFVCGEYNKALRAAEEAVRLSTAAGAGAEELDRYNRQLERNRKAAQAMSVLE